MVNKKSRNDVRVKKHMRIRNRFSGTASRPRLAVFRSNNHMMATTLSFNSNWLTSMMLCFMVCYPLPFLEFQASFPGQIIDDTVGNTLVSASTLEKEIRAELTKTNDVAAAAYLGTVIHGHHFSISC